MIVSKYIPRGMVDKRVDSAINPVVFSLQLHTGA